MAGQSQSVRIVAGKWRGHRINFASVAGLRPTSGRLKETLFNWLFGRIEGADCLDLFAGSGALGLEALSRGAAHTLFVDKSSLAVHSLGQSVQFLQAEKQAKVISADALKLLSAGKLGRYDLVFIDPPFQAKWLDKLYSQLHLLMQPDGMLYIECNKFQPNISLASPFKLLKQSVVGDTLAQLFIWPEVPQYDPAKQPV